jgi:nitrogen regulatory protein PII
MKTLMIVARDSMATELENLLQDNGINAYSIINKVGGKGQKNSLKGMDSPCACLTRAA